MAQDEAYQEVQQRIEAAQKLKATFLDLKELGLTTVPESIGNLSNLTMLYLSDNQLTEVIVGLQGIGNMAMALTQELDERGIAHLTASTTVNRPSRDDLVICLARATVFNGMVRLQGLGTDATKKVWWHVGETCGGEAAAVDL